MRIDIATLFPEICTAYFNESVLGRAVKSSIIKFNAYNIRDFTKDKHRKTDEKPYGLGSATGKGFGMILTAQPVYDCINYIASLSDMKKKVIFMTPAGEIFNQKKAIELSLYEHLIFLCGHYEGVDQRVLDALSEEFDYTEISAGDYVLTGGELPALMVADAVCRMIDGVLPSREVYQKDSLFPGEMEGLLEAPLYTRPEIWKGRAVPPVLLSGNHREIDKWRKQKSIEITKKKRNKIN